MPRPAHLGRAIRRAVARSVHSLSRTASRGLAHAVDPAAVAAWAVSGAPEVDSAARRAGRRIDALATPTPQDLIGNYLRGGILIGQPTLRDARFSYEYFAERGVIDVESKHVPRRVRQDARRLGFTIRFGEAFEAVLEGCRREEWTWITGEVEQIYRELFRIGLATSIAVFDGDRLVGGMWGLEIGRTFGAMSTFHQVDHAGAVAHLALCDAIGPDGRWDLVDLGPHQGYKERFGSRPVPVDLLLDRVLAGLSSASHAGEPTAGAARRGEAAAESP